MTEAEWQSTADCRLLLQFIKDKASPRRIRLFGVACCRRIAHLFHVKTCGKAVDVAERYADGLVTEDELSRWGGKVGRLTEGGNPLFGLAQLWRNRPACMSALAVYETLTSDGRLQFDGGGTIPYRAVDAVYDHVYYGIDGPNRSDRAFLAATAARDAEVAAQLALIREVFGNPLRPVAFDPIWRTEAVVGLATGIYDDRAFERLPILADALEEAGCDNADILSHCRKPGVHVRGCWAVDVVLGNE